MFVFVNDCIRMRGRSTDTEQVGGSGRGGGRCIAPGDGVSGRQESGSQLDQD